jgi:hypothetical protein
LTLISGLGFDLAGFEEELDKGSASLSFTLTMSAEMVSSLAASSARICWDCCASAEETIFSISAADTMIVQRFLIMKADRQDWMLMQV